MKMSKKTVMALLFLALPACASTHPALIAKDSISIETTSPSSNVRIVETSAVQRASGILVSGKVKRVSTNDKRYIPLGHIDVVLVDRKGVVMYESTTEYSPRIIPKKSIPRESDFSLNVPLVAPQGSSLCLTFHPDSHS